MTRMIRTFCMTDTPNAVAAKGGQMAIRPTQEPRNNRADGGRRSALGLRNRVPRVRRAWIATCLGAMLLGFSGCSSVSNGLDIAIADIHECIDESMTDYRNRAMAEEAWIRIRHCYHDDQYHRDFKKGFVAGYMDVAAGGDGCTPATAPSEYWGWKYQSSAGRAAINAWFQGYPLGAKAAEQDGVGNWREININLKTPAPLDPMSLQSGGLPGHPIPYVEGAEAIPAPLPAPSTTNPRGDSPPSEMPWGNEYELDDPGAVIEPRSDDFNLPSANENNSTVAEVEIAARSPQDSGTELFEPENAHQEFSDEFVNELFGAPAELENESGSQNLPFIFE